MTIRIFVTEIKIARLAEKDEKVHYNNIFANSENVNFNKETLFLTTKMTFT